LRRGAASAAFSALLLATGTAEAQPVGFTLTASPASRQVCDSAQVTYQVSVSGFGGFSDVVTLSVDGLPAGATAGFSANPVAPGTSSTLTIGNLGSSQGVFAVGIAGTAPTRSGEASVQLQVFDWSDCDFALAVAPVDPAACPGDALDYTVSVLPRFGMTDFVTLSADGAPPGAGIGFSPNPVGAGTTSTMTVSNLFGAPPGSYPLLVVGVSLIRTHEAGVSLVVPPDWRNEVGNTDECDRCTLVSPETIALELGEMTPAVIATVQEAGLTEGAGPNPLVTAELGHGPAGSDPRTDCRWRWVPAAFQADIGNTDRYAAVIRPSEVGSFAHTFRFSFDGGQSTTAADLDGAGAEPGLVFSPGELGVLEVPEPDGTGTAAVTALLGWAARRARGRSGRIRPRRGRPPA
jgi:hypothetical protein